MLSRANFMAAEVLIASFLIANSSFPGWRGKGSCVPPGLPPGPRPLPFLGNALQVDTTDFPRSVEKLSQRYGPIFTLHLGSQRAVVLFGHEVVREALGPRGEDFGGRGGTPILDRTAGGTGIGFSNGETWKQLRSFAAETLRELEAPTEEWIQEEAAFLAERLGSTEGPPCSPARWRASRPRPNVLCSVGCGFRFDYQDPEFLTFLRLLEENARLQTSPMTKLYNVFPALLDHLPGSHQTIFRNTEELKRTIAVKAEAQKEALRPGPPRNFIHAFLLRMEQEKQQQQQQEGVSVFNLQSLVRSTLDLFVAGAESTSLVLQYALMALVKYPKVQGGQPWACCCVMSETLKRFLHSVSSETA
uniref:Uncharacterized protein n=1 Tax=Anolis carolinensis TaxID=28377 RepID=H9GN06_ANOCA